MSPLIQREFADSPPWTLSRAIETSFEFHLAVLTMDAPRTMQVSGAVRPLVVVASDGAFEVVTGASVSALFHTPQRRWGWCGRLTDWVMEFWQPAANPIMKIEFYAILVGVISRWSELVGHDVVWYIDNTSALAAAIKGSSADPDVAAMAQVLYVLIFACDARIFWEYVESESNWADGASRDLLEDEWAKTNGFFLRRVREFRVPVGPLLERLEGVMTAEIDGGLRERLSPVVEALGRQRLAAVGGRPEGAAP